MSWLEFHMQKYFVSTNYVFCLDIDEGTRKRRQTIVDFLRISCRLSEDFSEKVRYRKTISDVGIKMSF